MSTHEAFQNDGSEKTVLFDLIDALNGLFYLRHRSPTLDGQIPLRAAQFCIPFVEGNGAGLHLYSNGSLIKKNSKKVYDFFFSDQNPLTTESYGTIIDDLMKSKLISSYWGRRLSEGISWHKDKFLYIWTGLLVRPRSEAWLALGGAYNRRVNINLEDLIYTDDQNYQPLILKVNLQGVNAEIIDFENEVATILVLNPDVQLTSYSLSDCPQEAKNMAEFYDEEYFVEKSKRPTNRYRKLIASTKPTSDSSNKFKLINLKNAKFEFCFFKSFVTSNGIKSKIDGYDRYQYAIVKNQFPIKLNWDGFLWTQDLRIPEGFAGLVSLWVSILGKKKPSVANLFGRRASPPPDEPLVNILPWILFRTPADWSSITDSIHFLGHLEGLRGVIWTDLFHHMMAPYKVLKTGRIQVRVGAPIMRIMPIPRKYLRPHFEKHVIGGHP